MRRYLIKIGRRTVDYAIVPDDVSKEVLAQKRATKFKGYRMVRAVNIQQAENKLGMRNGRR